MHGQTNIKKYSCFVSKFTLQSADTNDLSFHIIHFIPSKYPPVFTLLVPNSRQAAYRNFPINNLPS